MRRMTLVATAVLAVLLTAWTPETARDDARSDRQRIDTFVEDYLDRHGLPGATVAVVQDGTVVHEAGYGHDSDGEELDADSRMRIASVSKNITAFAVLRLVDDGKVGLDDPVVEHVPDFAVDEHVLAPNRMSRSLSTDVTHDHVEGLPNGHVTAYGRAFERREMLQYDGGAGSVVSTAHDMGRWIALQQRKGVTSEGTRLLSADLVEEARRPQSGVDDTGLGWHLGDERHSHSGVGSGYQAQMDFVPASGFGVAVLLNSNTPTFEHAYAISTGIIDITEDREPELGAPVATLVDLGAGAVTLLVLGLGALGVRRSHRWAERRAAHPWWRLALRMAPQVLVPGLAAWWFLVVPTLQGNSATLVDAFALFPAVAVLLLAAAAVGLVLTVAQGRWVHVVRR